MKSSSNTNPAITISLLLVVLGSCLYSPFTEAQPNILWIVTDDQRADALECFNMATRGKKESALGYVSSPNIDKLADEGVLFVNAFCNSPACGPSRGSMYSGRYPFRNGHYAFELSHQNPDFVKPSFGQTLQKQGYGTAVFGKGDSYIYKWGPGQGYYYPGHFNYKMHFKHDLQKNNVGDLWAPATQGDKKEFVSFPDGRLIIYSYDKKTKEATGDDKVKKDKVEKELDILRAYTRLNKSLILGGVNPQPAGKTVDGMIVHEFKSYLKNQNTDYTTSWGATAKGADANKPLMVNLGFHLPHTPVLPPKEFRDKFKKYQYEVPEFDTKELDQLPPQMKKMFNSLNMSRMTDEDKQQAIQDYYAFCAYGDALIGEAVEEFKAYCKKNNQEYVILYTVGDHGWHLGEQGIEAKFGPWDKSIHGALIVVASDKAKVPEGLIQRQLVEYVDVTPTILATGGVEIEKEEFEYLDGFDLMNFIGNKEEKREYIVGEIHLVAAPRAYLRSKEFAFSMRTKPGNKANLNENIRWALDCPVEDAELALYDLRTDPLERNNVAAHEKYAELAQWFRQKLGNIVLGDGRIECDWSKPNTYALSNFAQGADNKKLDIPEGLIPKTH
ncbi:sulfatase-like hydrolase/transferase [Flammeovirgaceae bacterium SG7u.111]|nr:sulfatase-like hydrolase/transferase [Flammeovirgaceae bacterium SG7u.132]WPO34438.1 sulfatase-like hydrolase/transferase [Flammeovirgaceae bacterium SG7u.111]